MPGSLSSNFSVPFAVSCNDSTLDGVVLMGMVPAPVYDWNFAQYFRFWSVRLRRVAAQSLADFTRRTMDITLATILLVGLSPLFAFVALLIKATDGGPVLFWQTRVGRWGREFRFPKFRSMVANAEQLLASVQSHNHHTTGVTFKAKNDPRVTWIGRIIRRASIDELPQLWCILIGQMTLVGPRPAVPREVARYTLRDRLRLDVAPGLTGLWQVSGRGDIPFAQQVALDLDYIDRQSLFMDLRILLKTVPAVVSGRGAY